MSIFRELKRRNVFRVAAAYAVAAWLIIEVSSTLEAVLHLPEWADTLLAFFLILGFPLAIFFSWAYEITPEGIRLEKDLADDQSVRTVTGRKLDRVVILLMAIALVYFAVDSTSNEQATAPPQVVAEESAEAGNDVSIAVLPFVNMSSDPEQEYFSDGLTEELLNLLAGIKQLKVAARTSSFFYKNKQDTVPLAEIARQLMVTHLLEGSVRKSGNTIRITAQLIKADDGFHIWSETYDRTLDDIFAIQDEIAAAVTEQLKLTLLGGAPVSRVIDTESWELTLKGRFFYTRRFDGDLERARNAFEQAVAIDPSNAVAWVGLSPLYRFFQDPPDPEKALAAVENALALDPNNPEAHIRLTPLLEFESEEWHKHVQLALELGPNNPLVLSIWSGILMYRGEIDAAFEIYFRAIEADPLHLVNLSNLTHDLLMFGRLDEAEEFIDRIQEIAPEQSDRWELRATLLLLRGQPRESLRLLDRISDDAIRSWLFVAASHAAGEQTQSDQAMKAFKQAYGDSHWLDIAQLHAFRGENDQAFYWLEQVLEKKEWINSTIIYELFLDRLHHDQRWEAFVTRVSNIQGL